MIILQIRILNILIKIKFSHKFIVLPTRTKHSTQIHFLHRMFGSVLIALYTLIPFYSSAQNTDLEIVNDSSIACYTIQNIALVGNKKTKDFIVFRELDFKLGDLICNAEFETRFKKNQNRIFNTGLFLKVKITAIVVDSGKVTLTIQLDERYYSYPIPIIGLADRNFNEWWELHGHSLDRLDWGLRFSQKNVRGRNETFKIRVEAGFNKKVELEYTFPYLNRNLKTGLSIYAGAIFNRQVGYATINQKFTYTENDKIIRTRYGVGLSLFRRANFYQTHALSTFWFQNTIADTVAILNPDYFLEGRTQQDYSSVRYSFTDDHRDIQFYPLKGYYFRLEAETNGAWLSNQIDYSFAKFEVSKFSQLYKRLYGAATLRGKTSNPGLQPYFNQKGLGYGKDVISGYELYVIDGQQFILSKMNVKLQLFSTSANIKEIPLQSFQRIPLAMYLKINFDAGYVVNKYPIGNERFANKWLYGYGMGFDFVTYYDFVIRTQYSINGAGEGGFFINFKAEI